MNIVQYNKPESLEEAWTLNQKKSARVLGGACWLRMSPRRRIQTAIDLMGLGLDQIEKVEGAWRIGCMTTLRALELSPELEALTEGALKESLRHIVGVQFRNMATIGGSIWGRFGFSDILTLFLVLDAEVELYKGGRMKLADFARSGAGRDILTHIFIPCRERQVRYDSLRLSATDFPVLACAVSRDAEGVHCALGARPRRAELVPGGQELLAAGLDETAIRQYARYAAQALTFGTNLRGSAEYRQAMAEVLVSRQLLKMSKGGNLA